MTMLVSMPETDRLAYGFVQKTLDLTGGNLTTHLRKLEDAGYLVITKEFQDLKPRTWLKATPMGRRAFAEYLSNLEKALSWQPSGIGPPRLATDCTGLEPRPFGVYPLADLTRTHFVSDQREVAAQPLSPSPHRGRGPG